ncbi:hypothetical protein PCANC_19295 [Puccinia coronata f. sp. avenae]|uniref:Uncharacterized protein n=1 Tax=Puccinia coronata f. sp. avenae TaxID=200324 RepID=A0A2N5SX55_9BASI|nr:hypothetical protein PCANC_15545 [Puccinia coronata f. sp. avenae]PLW38748.1 hypothetical protein PCANC_19295 [Puccinia coronata f. sp. avenae]
MATVGGMPKRARENMSGADESGDRLIAVRSPEFFGAAVGMSIKVGGAVGMPYS